MAGETRRPDGTAAPHSRTIRAQGLEGPSQGRHAGLLAPSRATCHLQASAINAGTGVVKGSNLALGTPLAHLRGYWSASRVACVPPLREPPAVLLCCVLLGGIPRGGVSNLLEVCTAPAVHGGLAVGVATHDIPPSMCIGRQTATTPVGLLRPH